MEQSDEDEEEEEKAGFICQINKLLIDWLFV